MRTETLGGEPRRGAARLGSAWRVEERRRRAEMAQTGDCTKGKAGRPSQGHVGRQTLGRSAQISEAAVLSGWELRRI